MIQSGPSNAEIVTRYNAFNTTRYNALELATAALSRPSEAVRRLRARADARPVCARRRAAHIVPQLEKKLYSLFKESGDLEFPDEDWVWRLFMAHRNLLVPANKNIVRAFRILCNVA